LIVTADWPPPAEGGGAATGIATVPTPTICAVMLVAAVVTTAEPAPGREAESVLLAIR